MSILAVPNILKYQFDEPLSFLVSDKCCKKMKEEPLNEWQRENKKSNTIDGLMREEGGRRSNINCILVKDNVVHFHPLAIMTAEWEQWFIEKFNVELCELYYPPFNFKRTGCKGCPFSLDLQEQLATMTKYLPEEREQCEIIWKPVYGEYRRIGYRLNKNEQTKLL